MLGEREVIRNQDGSYSIERDTTDLQNYTPMNNDLSGIIDDLDNPHIIYLPSYIKSFFFNEKTTDNFYNYKKTLEQQKYGEKYGDLLLPPSIIEVKEYVKMYGKRQPFLFITEKEVYDFLTETPENTGIAYQVHNAADKVDIVKLDKIIMDYFQENPDQEMNTSISSLNNTKRNELLNIIYNVVLSHIDKDEDNKLKNEGKPTREYKLNEIIKLLNRISSNNEIFKKKVFLVHCLYFMIHQTKPVINLYINSFIDDSFGAYKKIEGDNNPLNTMSCPKGVIERIYMLIPGALVIAEPQTEYNKKIIDLFNATLNMSEIMQEWAKRWGISNTEDEDRLSIYRTLEEEERKVDFVNFVIYRYIKVFGENLTDEFKKELLKLITKEQPDGIIYVFKDNDGPNFGGRRRRRRNRTTQRRKSFKHLLSIRRRSRRNIRRHKK